MRRLERRPARQSLADGLLAVAVSLHDASSSSDALDLLSRGLDSRGASFALLAEANGGFQVERATLPLAPDVWGRSLHLSKLTATLNRGRPTFHKNADEAFSEDAGSLLARNISDSLLAVPIAVGARKCLLCLIAPGLDESVRDSAWGLALVLGAVMAREATPAPATPPAEGGPAAADNEFSIFHELTRRLSHSLTGDEIARTSVELLASSLGLQLGATVSCRGGEHVTTVFAPKGTSAEATTDAATSALDAFRRLTGGKHRDCQQLLPEIVIAGAAAPGPLDSVLDAPLVTGGDVTGLIRIAAARADAFAGANERIFYTVAHQVSLALERAAAQREAERAQLASLAESLSDGVVLVDSALRITSCNSAARGFLESLAPGALSEDASVEGTPLAALAQEALRSTKPTSLRELQAPSTDVSRRYLVGMAAPLAGSPEGSAAVVILRDVTEERLMQERLLQSEKMVSVGQLVSGVAHELNNPLTGITGFAQLLLARELDERTRNDVETIYGEAERAAKIVQNLLTFARRTKAEKELVNLNALLSRVLELRTYDLRVKNIDVVLDLDDDLPETMVDADQIQQVFLNLITNAEQAMLASKDAGKLIVRSRNDGDQLRVIFQDDGPGMEPETLRRIFDPFFTTKQTGEGTGLGLTICYGIIDEHGGRIWAESQPGRGTTFFIELPVLQGSARPAAVPEEEQASTVTGRSVLVVDDEASIQRLLGSILQMDGHHVDTARNGVEALEYISRRRYDVIITDIKMPDMDGRELYQRLLEHDRAMAGRTIFITGDTVSPETRKFLQDVRNPCLAKPFRVRDVRDTITQVLEQHD
ncbi:MAG: ATP-binding protein [Dehalococcoidia bacterium]